MLPGLLMLCEDPKREVRQMDEISCFNGLKTTGTYTDLCTVILSNTCHETLGRVFWGDLGNLKEYSTSIKSRANI